MIYDKNIDKTNFKISNKNENFDPSIENEDDFLNKKNLNSYTLICCSKDLEYYVIDKQAYFDSIHEGIDNYMFQNHIQNLVISFIIFFHLS